LVKILAKLIKQARLLKDDKKLDLSSFGLSLSDQADQWLYHREY
jgi:hypothetical protein